jgi:ElaB/YqjD/DUF883 family membrane-anchored ribosome-binding protein
MEGSSKLMDDVRAALAGAEEVLRETAGDAEPKLRELEARIREHPWAAVGIAAGIGLLAGILLSRK